MAPDVETRPSLTPPRAGEVVVLWRAVDEAAEPEPAETAALSAAELDRAERYLRRADRNRFVLARAALRAALGAALGVPAAEVRFAASAHGKPVLAGAAAPSVSFNLSRTQGMIVLALARGARALGVDVECRAGGDKALSVTQYFQPLERAAIDRAPPDQRPQRFLRLWSRKEAVCKADGRGLSIPLDAICVLQPVAGDWRLVDLDIPGSYVGALAFDRAGPPLEVTVRRW